MSHGGMDHGFTEMEGSGTTTDFDYTVGESFEGHVEFAITPLLLGLWWMFNVSCRSYTSKTCNVPFISSTWFTWNRFPNTPVEPWIQFTVSTFVASFEVVHNRENGGVPMFAVMHALLYMFPLILSVVQLLKFYKTWVIPGFDYFCMVMNFTTQGFIIIYHLHSRFPVSQMIHVFLSYLLLSGALLTFLEAMFKSKPIFSMIRGMVMFQIGIHLIYIAFTVYPLGEKPELWDLHSHKEINMTIVCFATEILFVVIVAIVINGLVVKYYGIDQIYVKRWRQNVNGNVIYKLLENTKWNKNSIA